MSEQALPTTAEDIEALVMAFEASTLPRARWTHEAHLAVALWTLKQRPFNAALDHLRSRIRAYNDATGTANTDHSGYHETLTVHFLRGVSVHIARHPGWPLMGSLAALLASPLGERDWPLAAYSRARLESMEARRNWLEPDKGAKALWATGEINYQLLRFDSSANTAVHFSAWSSLERLRAFFEAEELVAIRERGLL